MIALSFLTWSRDTAQNLNRIQVQVIWQVGGVGEFSSFVILSFSGMSLTQLENTHMQ